MYIVGMIHNQKENRWHPVIFREYPHSGDTETFWRFKSQGHHTAGFASRELALRNIDTELIPGLQRAHVFLDGDFEWDGEGIPAIVHFFDFSALPLREARK